LRCAHGLWSVSLGSGACNKIQQHQSSCPALASTDEHTLVNFQHGTAVTVGKVAAKHGWRGNSKVTLAAQYDIVTLCLTCTKSSKKTSGSAYCGSLPNLATASQLRSTAQDSMWTKLCSIACRDARLPPLPSAGILPGATTLTYSCAQTLLNTRWHTVQSPC